MNRPVFLPLTNIEVTEGTPVEVILKATDPQNDPLTFSCAMLPEGSGLVGNTFNWTPKTGQAGTYMLAFVASDGRYEAFQTMKITVLPAPAETGGLSVDSTPPGAKIFLDGARTGKVTPYTFTALTSGSHVVNVTLSGYTTPADRTVAVTTGATTPVIFDLQKNTAVPEFPSPIIPAVCVIGFVAAVLLVMRTREN